MGDDDELFDDSKLFGWRPPKSDFVYDISMVPGPSHANLNDIFTRYLQKAMLDPWAQDRPMSWCRDCGRSERQCHNLIAQLGQWMCCKTCIHDADQAPF